MTPPPEFAKKTSLRSVFQLSIGKYVRQKLFKWNHVSWGVSNTCWTRSRCPKMFLSLFSSAKATFFVRQHQKVWNHWNFALEILTRNISDFTLFWCCLNKKVASDAEESLKNTFGHRERVQGVLLTPQLTWFHLKSFSLMYFPIDSWKTALRLVLGCFELKLRGGGQRKPPNTPPPLQIKGLRKNSKDTPFQHFNSFLKPLNYVDFLFIFMHNFDFPQYIS